MCIWIDDQGGQITFDVAKTASFTHFVKCAIRLPKTMPSLNLRDLACDDIFLNIQFDIFALVIACEADDEDHA